MNVYIILLRFYWNICYFSYMLHYLVKQVFNKNESIYTYI